MNLKRVIINKCPCCPFYRPNWITTGSCYLKEENKNEVYTDSIPNDCPLPNLPYEDELDYPTTGEDSDWDMAYQLGAFDEEDSE